MWFSNTEFFFQRKKLFNYHNYPEDIAETRRECDTERKPINGRRIGAVKLTNALKEV